MSGIKKISMVLALAILPVVFFHCTPSSNEKTENPADDKTTTIVEKPAETPVRTAEELWNKCSFCHSQKNLHGKTADDIKKAVDSVSAMKRFKSSLSDEEINVLGTLLSGAPQEEEYKYIISEACKTCHPKHLTQWKQSLHAMAHFEPVYDFYFIKASQDSDKKLETFCASCHTPIAVLNKNIPFPHPLKGPGDTKVNDIENDGVQCDFCHLISGVKELKNSGYEMTPSRTKFGPYKDSETKFHETAYSELHKSSDICGTCHNVDHPVNGIVLEATYTEWKNGPYAKEGVTCQDCHMTSGLTKTEIMPGKAAITGKNRDHVSEHYFVGPNLIYASDPGNEKIKELSQKLLRSAANIEIGEMNLSKGGINVEVLVTNKGAGHYIPTGVTEIREVWIELTAQDEAGNEFFHTGKLDSEGNIEKGSVIYFVDVIDETGTSTTQFWNTVKKVSDKRIPPKETVTESIFVPLNNMTGKIKIEVALNYRSVSPRGLAEVGVPPGTVIVPVFEMTSTKAGFDGKNKISE